ALATASTFCLISWAVSKRGPTYPSMFNPLYMIFVAIIEAVYLGQEISVGRYRPIFSCSINHIGIVRIFITGSQYSCSLPGMFVLLVGLYLFLRAKSEEL
ncbi:hypothetical protein HAX54_046525, partial [Datura stramonium]|nr:hypothetical protein [Datura stramonium]